MNDFAKRIRLILVLALLSFGFNPISNATTDDRISLVIGIGEYGGSNTNLPNAINDAKLIDRTLESVGFSNRKLLLNPTKGQLRGAIEEISRTVAGFHANRKATVLFFYAGHGVQFGGENYLIPSKSTLFSGNPTEADYDDQSVRAQWIVDKLSDAGAGRIIAILDACRNNPFNADRRGAEPGLAKMDIPKGGAETMIIFSAEPRSVAYENPGGNNSHFTRILADNIPLPGVDVAELFNIVKERVRHETKERQRPHVEGLMRFTFKRAMADQRSGPKSELAAITDVPGKDAITLLKSILQRRSLAELMADADAGDGYAMFYTGIALAEGVGGSEKNYRKAAEYLRKAVLRGVGRAASALGYMYQSGELGPVNDVEAVEWYRVGMEHGSTGAIRNLAFSYRDGKGVPKDPREALRLFRLAYEKGSMPALVNMSWLHRVDDYGMKDLVLSKRYLELAIESGHTDAAIDLANMYSSGVLGPKDSETADKILTASAEVGCAACWAQLANNRQAEISSRAENNTPTEVEQRDLTKLFAKGAEAGDAAAMVEFGNRLSRGEGAEKNLVKALDWYHRADLAGNPEGTGSLGKLLESGGPGINRDPERAAKLLRRVLELEKDPKNRFRVYVPNYWGYGQALARLHASGEISGASKAEAERLYDRFGGRKSGLKRFTVPINCGNEKHPFHIYVIDWKRDEPSTDEQAEWLKSERGCEVPSDVIESFRKLYKIAKDNNVAFSDLTVYALGNAQKESTSPTAASKKPDREDVHANRSASRSKSASQGQLGESVENEPIRKQGEDFEAFMMSILLDIGRYERFKRSEFGRARERLPSEGLDRTLEKLLGSDSGGTDQWKDTCGRVSVADRRRSRQSNAALIIWELDISCSGQRDGAVSIPDDPDQPIYVHIRTRWPVAGIPTHGGTSFGTRYVVYRGEGVSLSWHDLNGDGRPDALGRHRRGSAIPTETSSMSAGAF